MYPSLLRLSWFWHQHADTQTMTGITLFTLIHDPINGKPDIIVLYQARDNTYYAQISAHAGYFLEHLRLYL